MVAAAADVFKQVNFDGHYEPLQLEVITSKRNLQSISWILETLCRPFFRFNITTKTLLYYLQPSYITSVAP
jgi:hypothetical protein